MLKAGAGICQSKQQICKKNLNFSLDLSYSLAIMALFYQTGPSAGPFQTFQKQIIVDSCQFIPVCFTNFQTSRQYSNCAGLHKPMA